jgi:predicted ATPase
MAVNFLVTQYRKSHSETPKNTIVLAADNWDDYSYKTTFSATYYSSLGESTHLGNLKIGCIGQPKGWTSELIPSAFANLAEDWFSLGQDVDYYKNLIECFGQSEQLEVLKALRDVAADSQVFERAESEVVFSTSILRSVSISAITGQFRRVISGNAPLTEFHFSYRDSGSSTSPELRLDFKVAPESTPPTNIHVLIGRNGVGKTTLLNNIVRTILHMPTQPGHAVAIHDLDNWVNGNAIENDYFSSLVSVSFSAFDPFNPPPDQPDRSRGIAYFYVGMKTSRAGQPHTTNAAHKSPAELAEDFVASLTFCLKEPSRKQRWARAVTKLQSDENFADLNLCTILELEDEQAIRKARELMGELSSGHAIVLLTITKLVQTVEEKTLVLLDEPESHLHPPLLSAFIRALEDLLFSRNGVAIVATHSPVVVQEVPKSCVWIINRVRTAGRVDRPTRETFGENVGILTREVFGLEVSKSGFHNLLERHVSEGKTFEEITAEFGDQLGMEARAVLMALVSARDAE